MPVITGLHHVTVNAGDAQENLDFYIGVLGMRLVKRTVNQDAPGVYHFFFADGAGTPGTELTFFPWNGMAKGRRGAGETSHVSLAVPSASLDYWEQRLAAHPSLVVRRGTHFGEPLVAFTDPHGLGLSLVGNDDPRDFEPWADSPVPAPYQIRGLHAVRLVAAALDPTVDFLAQAFGVEATGSDDDWTRYAIGGGGSGRFIDVRADAGATRAMNGIGSVHHVAFRVPDAEAELEAMAAVREAGVRTTEVIDRFWFKSIYFREPGGALFEIATDGPGFSIDEDPSTLGGQLVLPPFLEGRRGEIERKLRPVALPVL